MVLEQTSSENVPARRDLIAIVITAIVVRGVLFLVAAKLRGWTAADFANLRDGSSYLHLAEALRGHASALTHFDRRVFVGFPSLIAVMSAFGVPLYAAALGINWVACGLSAALVAILYHDSRLGWAMAFLTPSYLMYSALAMSESTLLLFSVGGLVAFFRDRSMFGGILLGVAGIIRPTACFAVVGAAVARIRQNWRATFMVCAVSGMVVVVSLLLMQLWSGDALQSIKIYSSDSSAYAGHPFALPFESLVMTPRRFNVPLWKTAYIWLHVAVTIIGCVLVVLDARRCLDPEERALARLNAGWLIGNTAFVLCIGHIWGFQEFHRFILAALPPLLWAYRRFYPQGLLQWSLPAAVSFAMAVIGVIR
ncbi:MAG: hypothetical protein ACJ796_20700 [Gemmatimonadaceae bacterium]